MTKFEKIQIIIVLIFAVIVIAIASHKPKLRINPIPGKSTHTKIYYRNGLEVARLTTSNN